MSMIQAADCGIGIEGKVGLCFVTHRQHMCSCSMPSPILGEVSSQSVLLVLRPSHRLLANSRKLASFGILLTLGMSLGTL